MIRGWIPRSPGSMTPSNKRAGCWTNNPAKEMFAGKFATDGERHLQREDSLSGGEDSERAAMPPPEDTESNPNKCPTRKGG